MVHLEQVMQNDTHLAAITSGTQKDNDRAIAGLITQLALAEVMLSTEFR